MRKRLIHASDISLSHEGDSLDLERLAEVELTSEEPGYPVESAFGQCTGPGWRASGPGEQTIRLIFDEPQHVSGIHLIFDDSERERTQEFVLRWSSHGSQIRKEIVRQQYTFSPSGSTREEEYYSVDIQELGLLELTIVPDISGGDAMASLACLQLTR